MSVKINVEKVQAIAPQARPNYLEALKCANVALVPFGILNNSLRAAHFLAQILHESGGLKIERESLYYTTASRLQKVWLSRFPSVSSALPYIKNPEKLANKVYGNRLDLGNIHPGDGWKFIGRGMIQITGRVNYERYGTLFNAPFTDDPDLVLKPEYCLLIAAQYWRDRGCNAHADADSIRAVTRAINGGLTGLEDRIQWYAKTRRVIEVA